MLDKIRLVGYCSVKRDQNVVDFKCLLWISRNDHELNFSIVSANGTSVLSEPRVAQFPSSKSYNNSVEKNDDWRIGCCYEKMIAVTRMIVKQNDGCSKMTIRIPIRNGYYSYENDKFYLCLKNDSDCMSYEKVCR